MLYISRTCLADFWWKYKVYFVSRETFKFFLFNWNLFLEKLIISINIYFPLWSEQIVNNRPVVDQHICQYSALYDMLSPFIYYTVLLATISSSNIIYIKLLTGQIFKVADKAVPVGAVYGSHGNRLKTARRFFFYVVCNVRSTVRFTERERVQIGLCTAPTSMFHVKQKHTDMHINHKPGVWRHLHTLRSESASQS